MAAPRGLPIVDDAADVAGAAQRDARALVAAQRLLDQGHVADARAALAPLAGDPSTPVRAHAALLDAGLALMAGQPGEALAVALRVPRPAPFQVDEAYRAMIVATALRQQRRFADALVEAERAVALGATSGRLLVLADAQKHAGHVADAVATLERLLRDEPTHATALAQLAGYLHLLGERARADDAGARFEAAAADDADADRNRAFIALAKRDLDAALPALERALAREPAQTRAYLADEVELEAFRGDPRVRALFAPSP